MRRDLSQEERNNLRWLSLGDEGERRFDAYCEKYVGNSLLHLQDLDLSCGRTAQFDSILIGQDVIYHFEIKNYQYDLVFEYGKWMTEHGHVFSDNPLIQLNRARNILENIIKNFDHRVRIESMLVLNNPDITVTIRDQTDEVIIQSNQLKKKLENIQKTSSITNGKKLESLAQHLLGYKCRNPYIERFKKNVLNHPIKTGVICPKCGQTKIEFTKKQGTCSCGLAKTKTDLVKDLIDEYGVLYPNESLTSNKIYAFINQEISERLIRQVLIDNFEKYGECKKPVHFLNPYRPVEE